MLNRILLALDPADGGVSCAPPSQPPSEVPHHPPTSAPAAPLAAAVVAAGQRSERENTLQSELAEERQRHATTAGEKTARENRINQLEDELFQLKRALGPSVKKTKAGWTFFDDEEA